jgi:hypothetical protein
MALRLLLSNRIIIPQRTLLTRFCRYYTPLTFEHRSTITPPALFNSSPSGLQFKTNTPLLSTNRTYFLSFKFASSSSSTPSSSSDGSVPSSPSDGKSSSSSFSSSNDGKNQNNDDDGGNDSADSTVPVVIQAGNPLMPVEVPENYPIVPLIPVSRHPLFPKFIKMLEITNKDLMELIRRKVKLNQPYAGIFLRKETSTTSEKPSTLDDKTSESIKGKEKLSNTITSDVIKNLDEVYKIGSFVQIHEVHDMGDRLRMIVMAHRRIKIVGIASDELEIEDVDRRRPPQKSNGNRRRQRRKGKTDLNRGIKKFFSI